MSLFFHYHDTHDIPIGDRTLTEENNLVIIAENKKTGEKEYVAYIDDFSGEKPELITSDDLSYAERKNDFLHTSNEYFDYARKCNETFPHLSFYAVRAEDCREAIHETHKVRGFHEEVEGVVHRPVGTLNRYAYLEEKLAKESVDRGTTEEVVKKISSSLQNIPPELLNDKNFYNELTSISKRIDEYVNVNSKERTSDVVKTENGYKLSRSLDDILSSKKPDVRESTRSRDEKSFGDR